MYNDISYNFDSPNIYQIFQKPWLAEPPGGNVSGRALVGRRKNPWGSSSNVVFKVRKERRSTAIIEWFIDLK